MSQRQFVVAAAAEVQRVGEARTGELLNDDAEVAHHSNVALGTNKAATLTIITSAMYQGRWATASWRKALARAVCMYLLYCRKGATSV